MFIKNIYSAIALGVLVFFIACSDEGREVQQKPISHVNTLVGDYESDEGDLKITATEGMVLFNLLVVADTGRTGTLEGELILNKSKGIYKNKDQDCDIAFHFSNKQVKLLQKGSCEMGMGVSATGTYKAVNKTNTPAIIGKIGDSLGSLFYGKDASTYKKYCKPGMEEESGEIICKTKKHSGDDNTELVHIFSGEYAGPDGVLPPLSIAKEFQISLTRTK